MAYALVVLMGVDPESVLVPFLIAEAAGVALYVAEIRYRFKYRGGRR